MPIMRQLAGCSCTLATLAIVAVLHGGSALLAASRDESGAQKGKKPSISLKVTPSVALAPVKIRAAAELRGGADDYEEYYCPTVEWDWGDETTSESTKDCEPYVEGRSEISRRFAAEHTYQESGMYKITLRLKRKDKVLALSSASVQVQPGLSGR
jgi:hypothetical protein